MNEKKDIATLCISLFIVSIFLMSFLMPDKTFSKEEHRYLAQRPNFLLEKFLDGSYTCEYEDYFSDQFPMRNMWINIKSEIDKLLGIDSD